jgi:hypothetical protein
MTAPTSQISTHRSDLHARCAELVRRLNAGDEQISTARQNGADTTRWENHWITLLREYESVCRELDESAGSPLAAAA